MERDLRLKLIGLRWRGADVMREIPMIPLEPGLPALKL
jgi:hypothetical protein